MSKYNPTDEELVALILESKKITAQSQRPGFDPYRCPFCGYHNTARLTKLYEAGTKDFTVDGYGHTIGGRPGYVYGRGTQKNRLAQRIAPPPIAGKINPLSLIGLLLVGVFLYPFIIMFIYLIAQFTPITGAFGVALVLGPVVYYLVTKPSKDAAFNEKVKPFMELWLKTWMCSRRCQPLNKVFPPSDRTIPLNAKKIKLNGIFVCKVTYLEVQVEEI
jgi:hypothetical protein